MEIKAMYTPTKTSFCLYVDEQSGRYVLQLQIKGQGVGYVGSRMFAKFLDVPVKELEEKVYYYNGEVDCFKGRELVKEIIFFKNEEDADRMDKEYLAPLLLAAKLRGIKMTI